MTPHELKPDIECLALGVIVMPQRGQVMVGGGQHGLTIGLRHEAGRHTQRRQAHDQVHVARDVVVDEDASPGLRSARFDNWRRRSAYRATRARTYRPVRQVLL